MELKLNEALERTSSLKLEAKIYTPTAGKQTTCYIWTCPILPVFRYSHSHYSKKKKKVLPLAERASSRRSTSNAEDEGERGKENHTMNERSGLVISTSTVVGSDGIR